MFPLPGAILLPRAQLPLHIFEDRYRAMARHALAGDRRIGMIQPRGEAKGKGAPPLFAMLADERHTNVHGIVHGGMLMTFADTGMGITVWEALGRKPCVTIQFNIQFLDAAQPGEFLELDVQVLRQSSTVVFVRGLVRSGERQVAAADGVWKTIRPR